MDNFLRKPLLCLFLGLALVGNSAMAYQKPSKPPAASSSRGLIAFIRKGNVWIVGADGKGERQLTQQGNEDEGFSGLAADGRRFVCISDTFNVSLFEPPHWQPQQVTSTPYYNGIPVWLPGTNKVFVGKSLEDGPDNGLWLMDTHQHSARRVLPASDASLPTHNYNVLSPDKRYLVSFDTITDALFAQALDLRTWKPVNLRGWEQNGLMGGRSMAWLDDSHLLVGRVIGIDVSEDKGALWLLDIKTQRFRRWLYPIGTEVGTLLRQPEGDDLIVGLKDVDIAAKFDPMVSRLELVNLKTHQRRRLPIPGPLRACQFSTDGKQLLVLIMRPHEKIADAYIVDLRTSTRRLVARDATEAVWIPSER